jgi:RNA polymerase sigma-70 factor (ECF subfamily)
VKEISDEEALRESFAHPELFGVIYERYHDKIFSHIYKLTQNIDITKDLTEETFYQVIKYRDTIIKSGAPFERYIYRISTNKVYDYFRQEKRIRRKQDKFYTIEEIKQNADEKDVTIDDEELKDAINNLPEFKRICIITYYFEGRNIEEIALILDKGKATISRTLNEARKDLYVALWKKFEGIT